MKESDEQTILKKFGQNLKKIRMEKNLSTRELSDLADVNLGNLSDLELGKKNPMLTTMLALANALQVDPCSLLPTKS